MRVLTEILRAIGTVLGWTLMGFGAGIVVSDIYSICFIKGEGFIGDGFLYLIIGFITTAFGFGFGVMRASDRLLAPIQK